MSIQSLLDLVYPRTCSACSRNLPEASENLCWDCRADILPVNQPYCSRCGDPVSGSIDHEYICHFCYHNNPGFDLARSAAHYSGPVADMLKALKYQQSVWLVPDIAALLVPLVHQHIGIERIDTVTAVPLHHSRRRVREFNQSALIAARLAREIERDYMGRIVVRHRKTPSQTSLTAAQRISNVKGCFTSKNRSWLAGRNILLVDDVMTTGATVSECARTLKKGGANAVYVVTVARGVK